MTTLVEKVVSLSESLTAAGVPHAFGGALAYCTEDPRGTRDVDVNAFVPATEPQPVLAALPPGVTVPPRTAEVIVADGQVRLWWDDTPVDLFLDYAPLHAQAARGSREGLSPAGRSACWDRWSSSVFKALFDRPKDWVDIATVLEAGAVAPDRVRDGLVELVGRDDPRVARWDASIDLRGTPR